MSLAQGNPFVLSYRLHIIGLAQQCNWVTCRVCFTIFSLTTTLQAERILGQTVWPARLKSGRLTTSLAGTLSPS